MYVDGLVFVSESVPLFRTEEFSTYNISSTCCTNVVELGSYWDIVILCIDHIHFNLSIEF